jgi:1-phosphofructokinase
VVVTCATYPDTMGFQPLRFAGHTGTFPAVSPPQHRRRVCIFAPAPLLTVTIEQRPDDSATDEIHLHAGGQGFWIARLVAELGVEVVLCGSFGGETGRVVEALIAGEGVTTRGIAAAGSNGAYIHDRRSGQRVETAIMAGDPLSRHELDELYGIVLLEGIESSVAVLGGPTGPPIVPPATYRRLASDLRATGTMVIADLSGEPLREALAGGVDVLKISEDELVDEGRARRDDPAAVVLAMRQLVAEGAAHVVTTRAAEPALALVNGSFLKVRPPRLTAEDHRGAGDSLTAGIAATLAVGGTLPDGLRLGAAAGALNVTRRGLATGHREEIERLTTRVDVAALDGGEMAGST